MKNITCRVCKKGFQTRVGNTLYCSSECRILNYKSYLSPIQLKMCAGTVGAVAEMEVALELLKNGYNVFRSLSPACPCDLIVFKSGGSVFRVEVKTGYRNTKTGNLIHPPHANSDFDIWAIYERASGVIYYAKRDKSKYVSLKELDKLLG